jgi:hypothetical protein
VILQNPALILRDAYEIHRLLLLKILVQVLEAVKM